MNTKSVLITGARAPVALEIARILKRLGHTVYTADSLPIHVCVNSKSVAANYICPAPREHERAFIDEINHIVTKQSVDLIIPTSEEAFYLSKYKADLQTEVLVESLETMRELHHKYRFIEWAKRCKLTVPATWVIHSESEWQQWQLEHPDRMATTHILKPAYSRFGTHVRTLVPAEHPCLPFAVCSTAYPWVIQEYLDGEPICVYAIARNGKLNAYADYAGPYLTGGAFIYFQYQQQPAVLEWVKSFIEQTHINGQISIDFILKEGIPYPLECNPRTTSGAHLFSDHDNFDGAFFTELDSTLFPTGRSNDMIAAAMLLFGWRSCRNVTDVKRWVWSFLRGRDVIFRWNDLSPAVNQWRMLLQVRKQANQHKLSLTEMIMRDLEWNG